jgi:hypothetical protein
MPVYCYTTEHGDRTIERFFPLSKEPNVPPRRIKQDGRWYFHDLASEHRSFRNTPGAWPMWSRSHGVAKDQIQQEQARDLAAGVPCRFDSRGRREFVDRSHRRKWMKARGYCDMDAGYSDHGPTQF